MVEKDRWYSNEFSFEAIEIFHICCLLDLSQTNKYFETILSKKKYLFINKIYHDGSCRSRGSSRTSNYYITI